MKKLFVLLLLLVSLGLYWNRNSTAELSGTEIDSCYRWGREYIFAKDLLPLGFEAVWDGNTLSITYGSEKPDLLKNKDFPLIEAGKKFHLKLNNLSIDYQILHGNIALCIDDFCNLEKTPPDGHSHPDEYYSALRPLGYTAYFFRKDAGRSISFLPFENRVVCNMGSTAFINIDENAVRSEMENYCDLAAILREMNAKYQFQSNVLDISEKDFQEISFPLPSQVTNYSALGYPILSAEIFSPHSQKISAYIVKGRLKVHIEEFCKAYGFHYSRENGEDQQERMVIKNG